VDGADEQVMTRSLAEQLVSEANAVLSTSGSLIDLRDEIIDGQLSFVMRYTDRTARVSTSFTEGSSIGHLEGIGARCHGGRSRRSGAVGEPDLDAHRLAHLSVPDSGTVRTARPKPARSPYRTRRQSCSTNFASR
jgi:hypothetical protein